MTAPFDIDQARQRQAERAVDFVPSRNIRGPDDARREAEGDLGRTLDELERYRERARITFESSEARIADIMRQARENEEAAEKQVAGLTAALRDVYAFTQEPWDRAELLLARIENRLDELREVDERSESAPPGAPLPSDSRTAEGRER